MKSKTIAVILAASTVFSLAACVSSPGYSGSSVNEESVITKGVESTSEENTEASEIAKSFESDRTSESAGTTENKYHQQLKVILDNTDKWFVKQGGPDEEYYYAILDLDNDSHIEIVRATTQGTGHYTYVDIYEVNDAVNGLIQIAKDPKVFDFPDIITEDIEYFDNDGVRYFNVKNGTHINSSEGMTENTLLSVRDNQVVIVAYSSEHVVIDKDGKEHVKYFGRDSKEISSQEYIKINDSINGTAKLYTANFKWKLIEKVQDAEKLLGESMDSISTKM